MPLEQLLGMSYTTSVSKRKQSVKNSAAAVFVLSQEDIRRSGVTTIPDALRLVPGLQVAQIDANKWAITSRGFNDRFSAKVLVMIDGRTVYTPVFSGVYWHREDTMLEDVDRIEVIRGVGAAMWGSNAMDGVINIITKSAKDTQGTLLSGGGGNQEQGFGSARYGGKIGDDLYYRVYAKGFNRNHNRFNGDQNAQDDWEGYQGGFRSEWQPNQQDSVTFQGDAYHSRTGDLETFALPYAPYVVPNQDSPASHDGGNIQARWRHKISADSETSLQAYYKQDNSSWSFLTPYDMRERTVDVDFQHNFNWLGWHDIVWGAGYRYFDLLAGETFKFSFNPSKQNLQLFSAFVQDDMSLIQNELKLTIGSRLEHNDFTGYEIQPNIRLLWTPNTRHSLWGAVSRAVRIPNMVSTSLNNFTNPVPPDPALPLPAIASLDGNGDMLAEKVLAYELGYRWQPTPRHSLDVAAFYNQYNDMQALQFLDPQLVAGYDYAYLDIPLAYTNKMDGERLGIEVTGEWRPTDWLSLQGSYWVFKSSYHTPTGLSFFDGEHLELNSPDQQAVVRMSLNLPYDIELDTAVRYVDSIPRFPIESYCALDLRLAWHATKNLELSVVGKNLLDNQHPEFKEIYFLVPQTEIQRSVFGKFSLSF